MKKRYKGLKIEINELQQDLLSLSQEMNLGEWDEQDEFKIIK